MMDHIGNLQLLQKKLRIATMKNCFIKNESILTLSSYLHGRIINSVKNISLLCCRREVDNLHGKKNWPLLANLSEVFFFYRRTMLAFEIDQFVLVLNICL